ncbi:MAG: D-alanyl-D-alanine carboxypeptidase [Thiotrichales bacterium]|nr:D-alanyl-D-alanine carboxypeptidase [Thiotrichales bacterium]
MMKIKMGLGASFLWLMPALAAPPQTTFSGKEFAFYQTLAPAALLVAEPNGKPLFADAAQQALIPASTTKLITALLALQHWGADHHFVTEFKVHIHPNGQAVLHLQSSGDPFLVSEELARIAIELAKRLRAQGIYQLAYLQMANRWYAEAIRLPGTGESLNPYDAINSAFSANFNSLHVLKKHGQWLSAEPQTPITPTALQIIKDAGLRLKDGQDERINTGTDPARNQQYAAELLIFFLRQQGIEVLDETLRQMPVSPVTPASVHYQHANQKNLAQVISAMLRYSTNFIANQLALNLVAEKTHLPAQAAAVSTYYAQALQHQFGWDAQQVRLVDGAGLSRQNRLSAHQLWQVLQALSPWRELLPEIEPGVFAKSGSLVGVSTLAGYFYYRQQWWPFVFLANQPVPYRYRNQLAKALYTQLPKE